MPRPLRVLLIILVNLLVLEGALRLQQALGPAYDLVMADIDRDRLSDTLNHVPRPVERWELKDEDSYGRHLDHAYEIRRDALHIRNDDTTPPPPGAGEPFTILMTGDSFCEGYDAANTIVHHAERALREMLGPDRPVRLLNAGHSSYSTAIFTPQLRGLIPATGADLTVVVVDQADLGDDFVRYEHLIRRDAAGRIVAVAVSPVHEAFFEGLIEARDHPFFVQRFVTKLAHTYGRMPRLRAARHEMRPYGTLDPQRDQRGDESTYAEPIAIFERNLAEMITTVDEVSGGPGRLLLVTHPHVQQIVPEPDGFFWHTFTTDAVARVAARTATPHYDATHDFLAAFDGDPAAYYWPGNMHLNFEGIAIYGRLIAERIRPAAEAHFTAHPRYSSS